MTIAIINSQLRTLPDEERRGKALQIAQLAYNCYVSRTSLERVSVVFVVQSSYLFVFIHNDATDSFDFKAAELVQAGEQ